MGLSHYRAAAGLHVAFRHDCGGVVVFRSGCGFGELRGYLYGRRNMGQQAQITGFRSLIQRGIQCEAMCCDLRGVLTIGVCEGERGMEE